MVTLFPFFVDGLHLVKFEHSIGDLHRLFRCLSLKIYNVICGLRLYVQGDWQIRAQEPRFQVYLGCFWMENF